jgi:hypothetical protein
MSADFEEHKIPWCDEQDVVSYFPVVDSGSWFTVSYKNKKSFLWCYPASGYTYTRHTHSPHPFLLTGGS